LRVAQQGLLGGLLESLRLDLTQPPPPDLRGLFSAPIEALHLEIGFGGGEHLLAHASRQRQSGFIGIEPFVNGMAKLLSSLDQERDLQDHIRLYDDDACLVLDWLPHACLDSVDIFYPDPWPKKKHHKRRFINPPNLDRLARTLKPGGRLRFASDIVSYVEWTLLACCQHGAFALYKEGTIISEPTDALANLEVWQQPYPHWHSTRYEMKALREGRQPFYLTFLRL